MAVNQTTDARPAERSPVLVSRQPVVDLWDRVAGYRIFYAVLDGDRPVSPPPDQASRVMSEVLEVVGREEAERGARAHIPISREVLVNGGVPPIAADRVVLRIRHEDTRSAPVMRVLQGAADRGYQLELDRLAGPEFDNRLLDLFKKVEIDFPAWTPEDVTLLVPKLRARGVVPLGTGIETHVQREQARSLGCEWFSGPFFATPNLLAGKSILLGDMRTLVELTRLQGGEAPLEELVSLIERDLGLGVRLLRYINSAYFGLAGGVKSIRHAAAMLGTRGLSRWALVAATVGGGEQIPRELMLLALSRARACELVAADQKDSISSDEMFTVGLLSAVDAVFRMPLETVVDELPLADEVRDALLHRSGPAGRILASVTAYEDGEFLAPTLRASLMTTAEAYRDGLAWARDALAGLA